MVNVFEPGFDPADDSERPGFSYRRARVGRQAGAQRFGASVYELPPGQAMWPYHWHAANEEMLIVLSGHPRVRTPEGWRDLEPGDIASFERGPGGAHQVHNSSQELARVLMLSEMNAPELVVYPDSNKAGVQSRPPGATSEPGEIKARFRFEDAVDYFEGEQPPDPE